MTSRRLKHGTIELRVGNIVDQDTDVIVNAANTKLRGGGGVDGAIHRAAGPELTAICLRFPADDQGRRCRTGGVQTTVGCNLKAKYVVHAVGPFYNERYRDKAHTQLREVHTRALQSAIEHGCRSVSFPAISTGAYRFPIAQAATTAIDAACVFVTTFSGIDLVRFVLFRPTHLDIFGAALADWRENG